MPPCRLVASLTLALALASVARGAADPEPAAAGPRTAPSAPAPSFEADVRALGVAAKTGRCAESLPLVRRVTERFRVRDLSDDFRAAVWTLGAACAARTGQYEESFLDAREATRTPGAADAAWTLRFNLAADLGHTDDAVETAESLAGQHQAILQGISAESLYTLDAKLKSAGAADKQARLFAALAAVRYQPAAPFESVDGLWLEDAVLLAEQRDDAAVVDILSRIRDPRVLIRVQLDRRFAWIIAADPPRFDPRAAALAALTRDQAEAKARPDLLKGVLAISQDLVRLNRPAEALAVVEAARRRAAGAAMPSTAFSDWVDQENWLANERASDLWELGRFAESVQAMREGMDSKEHGSDNVSQVINLAENLVDLGQPVDALAMLEVFDEPGHGRSASPYGYMQVMVTRVCAYAQTGDASSLEAAKAWLAAHASDSAGTLTQGLLCANDLDAAAASYVRRLGAPLDRLDALVELSAFAEPVAMSPWDRELRRRARLVRDRPRVREAVARAGRTGTFALRPVGEERTY